MKINKQEVVLLSSIIIAVIILILVIIFSLIKSVSPHLFKINIFPTPTIVQINNSSSSTPLSSPVKYNYNEVSQSKLIEMLLHPPLLAPNDALIKNRFITSLNGHAGDLYATTNVTVSYLPSVKEFEGEIKTINIDLAKKEAVDWLKSKGMSQDGICHLPLEFFLNTFVARDPHVQGITFDTLPPGC